MGYDLKPIKLPDLTLDVKGLFKAQYPPDFMALLLSEFSPDADAGPYFSGLVQTKDYKTSQPEEMLPLLGRHLVECFQKDGWKWRHHLERRNVLEKALRLFQKAEIAGCDVAFDMGRAYLLRARIIQPRGHEIPPPKAEALNKAYECCMRSQNHLAMHYCGLIALELERCGETPNGLQQILSRAVSGAIPEDNGPWRHASGYFKILLRLAQLQIDKEKRIETHTQSALENIAEHKDPEMALELFMAASLMPRAGIDIKSAGNAMVEELRDVPFAHPIWDEAARFTIWLYRAGKDGWRMLAILLWKLAEKKTLNLSAVYLRWYWSRQKDLYDLAFLAAIQDNNINLAARVADSVKSKPALTLQKLENMAREEGGNDTILKQQVELSGMALSGWYIKDLPAYQKVREIEKDSGDMFPEAFDGNVDIVQFYIVELEGVEEGYALVYDSQTKGWCFDAEKHIFDYKPILKRFFQWQSRYHELQPEHKAESGSALAALCQSLGEELKFLNDFKQDAHVLFVPHGFLHRVPLHAGLIWCRWDRKDQDSAYPTYSYLPALRYVSDKSDNISQTPPALIKYFDRSLFGEKKRDEAYTAVIGRHFGEQIFTSFEAFEAAVSKQPGFMAILCHGKADLFNSFKTQLKLETPLYLDMLASKKIDLTGTMVFIAACESDLTATADAVIDEHLSVAGIFINKHTYAVLTPIWEYYPYEAKLFELFNNLQSGATGEDIIDNFFDNQIALWRKYAMFEEAKSPDWESLYHCLNYKLYYYG